MRALSYPELLERLVAFESVSDASNLPLVDWLCEVLDRPGCTLVRDVDAGGEKANLVVRLGPEPDPESRAGLVLSGHLDVVPPGEEADWSSPPFVLTDRGDRWVARGACDMKGFVALAVELASTLDPARLAAPLVLLLTHDEEVGSLGAARFAAGWGRAHALPRSVVIGEPTGLEVVRLHKGHLRLRITTRGRSAHSGHPEQGKNAIVPAGRIVSRLAELARRLAGERPEHAASFPEVPYVALNVARIAGGTAINVVPDRCTIEVGLRPLPGMRAEPLVERVRTAVAETAAAGDWELSLLGESPPLLTPETAPIHAALAALLAQGESAAAAFASDAGHLSRAGFDCVLFGPGSIGVAHRPDEFLPKADVARAREVLAALVARFCSPPAGARPGGATP